MNTRRTSSSLASQSMGIKDICILIVHDDPMYHNIIIDILQNCNHYEVMKFQKIGDALNTMQEKRDSLNIVITDVHQSNSNGFEILNYIEREFKLEVKSMNPRENAKEVSVELSSCAKLYFIKSLSKNEFKTLWEHAYTKERAKATSFWKASIEHDKEDKSLERELPSQEERLSDQKQKRKAIEDRDEQSEEDKYGPPKQKKQRVVWNEQMHNKFLTAVEQLGHDRAYPKKIVEIMNVPGLTRENVASHLQKYKLHLKRALKEMQSASSDFQINSPPPGFFKSSHSDFNSTKRNYLQYHIESPTYTPYQLKLNPTNIPVSISNFSYPETPTTILNYAQQKPTFAVNNFQFSKTEINTNSSNIHPLVPDTEKITSIIDYSSLVSGTEHNTNPISMPMPLIDFSCPNLLEISTSASNLVHQESLLSPYTQTSSVLLHENPQPDSSNNNTYVGFKLSDNGISFEHGQKSTPKNNDNATDNSNLLDEGKQNESIAEIASTEANNDGEQRFYVPQATCEIEDLLDDIGGGGSY